MTRFNVGQLVRVTNLCSLAYGRVAQVVVAEPQPVKVQFVDLPKSASGSQRCAGSFATFESSELTPVNDVPTAAFYLLVTVVERDGLEIAAMCITVLPTAKLGSSRCR